MALSLSGTIHVFLDSQINRGQVVASCSSPKQKGYIHSYKWFLRAAEADGKHILNFHSSMCKRINKIINPFFGTLIIQSA